MEKLTDNTIESIIEAAQGLSQAASHLPILRSVSWTDDVKVAFLKTKRLPRPVYSAVDTAPARDILAAIKIPEGEHPVFACSAACHSTA